MAPHYVRNHDSCASRYSGETVYKHASYFSAALDEVEALLKMVQNGEV
jgi:hypothetical protein